MKDDLSNAGGTSEAAEPGARAYARIRSRISSGSAVNVAAMLSSGSVERKR